jgi:hypothetical protein
MKNTHNYDLSKIWIHGLTVCWVVLGGVMVIVVATGPNIRKFKTSWERDGFIREIKIQSTTSFRGEVKPFAPMS